MSFKYQDEIDMNLFASILKDAVSKVKTEEDPEVLTDLKKQFKKNVPFTLRMYVAAYLAKQAMTGRTGGYRSRRENRDSRYSTRDWKSRETRGSFSAKPAYTTAESAEPKETETRPPRVEIDPSVAATVFIGIGRNRRVYPRDLVGLLVSVAQLDRDRIGDIRVLANYSFVQLFSEDAEKTIAALNGYDYRGRKLAVSYSRQKDAEDGDETAQPYVSDSASYSADASIDENQLAEDAAAYAAAEKAAANNEPFSAPHISSEPDDAPKNDYLV